jgi:ribonucleoside-triphosphate reductase
MIEGSDGNPFTFPLLTYKITKDFKWDSEISNLIFQYAAKWGGPYFSNYLNTEFDENDALSMCCRLRLNVNEIQKISGGLWAFGNNTGSLAVVTINMPQLGYKTKGDEKTFYLRLDSLMEEAKEYLLLKKSYIMKGMELGLYPMSKNYIGGKMASSYFLTIGLNGLNECSMNFCGKNIIENANWCEEILKHMKAKTFEFQQETGQLFNFEATPAEGAGATLAKLDKKNYPDMFIQGNDSSPYYTGSSFIPHNEKLSLSEAILHQEKLQRHYTGGTVFHIDSGEHASPESVKKIIKSVCTQTTLPYVTWSPTYGVCPEHGQTIGKEPCCEKSEIMSRIVGFYRPISRWNSGKLNEFNSKEFIQI